MVNFRPAGLSDDDSDYDDDYSYSGVKPNNIQRNVEPTQETDSSRLFRLNVSKDELLVEMDNAVRRRDLDRVQMLVGEGVSVQGRQSEWSPLMLACINGDAAMASYLLEHGADPNYHHELTTPLMACVRSTFEEENFLQCVEFLLGAGAHVNAVDKYHQSALMLAAGEGLSLIVERLLATPGIQINHTDKDQRTALYCAAEKGHLEVVQLLVNAGCDTSIVNSEMCTAADVALLKDFKDIINVLLPNLILEPEPEPHIEPEISQLENFFLQLPDNEGNGGFPEDVSELFRGVDLHNVFEKLPMKPDLISFLVMRDKDLDNLGVKYSWWRWKILSECIHKFHLRQWSKTSMYDVDMEKQFDLSDAIVYTSNILKHLCIIKATLQYVQLRLVERIEAKYTAEDSKGRKETLIVDILHIYDQIRKQQRLLSRLTTHLKKIPSIGAHEADFIGPPLQPSKWKLPWSWTVTYGLLIVAATCFISR